MGVWVLGFRLYEKRALVKKLEREERIVCVTLIWIGMIDLHAKNGAEYRKWQDDDRPSKPFVWISDLVQ